MTDVFNLEGREHDSYSKQGKQFYGVTNPFVLPDHSGVRYYDLSTLNGGHLLVMLDNAKWIADKQIRAARVKSGEIDANDFPDARDRWAPRTTPKAFETVIQSASSPTNEALTAAIHAQFDCVLQRPATKEELAKYQDEFGEESFTAGIGAEAVLEMLKNLDLELERKNLVSFIKETKSKVNEERAIKRLKLIESFIETGQKPEWMIMTVVPVIPPESVSYTHLTLPTKA